MGLLDNREYYKPFDYPWAFQAYHTQQKMHWLPEEVPLHEDVKDWQTKLSTGEKNLLTQIFRFFTQSDLEIATGYIDCFLPIFKKPEIRMMLAAFTNMESIHMHAYSLLLDTIGMPEVEYRAFRQYEEMSKKSEHFEYFIEKIKMASKDPDADKLANRLDIALALAGYSAFGEGLQLFSSFAMLLNFPRFNKMKGMGQIVTWSIRDESLHVESMMQLFKSLLQEYCSSESDMQLIRKFVEEQARISVQLEDCFIDLAFEMGEVEGMTPIDVKNYIRYIADRRLEQLGFDPIYNMGENPLPWLDWILNGVEHANFFENRSTEYAKGSLTGSWQEVWNVMDNKPYVPEMVISDDGQLALTA